MKPNWKLKNSTVLRADVLCTGYMMLTMKESYKNIGLQSRWVGHQAHLLLDLRAKISHSAIGS